jgi:hypothetical protein
MDAACQSCHRPHSFHQASVANDTSCSACHLEHQGRGQNLLAVNPSHCTACHGDNSKMADAAALARRLDPALFTKKIADGSVAFAVARPPEGLTARITSFATDHPEFRLHAPGTTDPDPLAFNHALHLTGEAIPLLDGKPLDCRSCHVPDQSGALMQPVRFALHCQSCHDLPIDPATPSVAVPHGSAEAARAFLRALPAAYSDDAIRRLGLSGEPLRAHVAEKLDALHLLHPSGEALERKVFFGDPSAPAGRDSCSLCHVVEAAPAGATPRIAPARVPDIWMPHARFDHARHTQVACVACHAATTSVLTNAQNPLLVHVASHGYYARDSESPPPTPAPSPADGLRSAIADLPASREDAMLNSGIVLAGANRSLRPDRTRSASPAASQGNADDGYLTAKEAAQLQLRGTELVVLSACDTASGDQQSGEGLFGLQRALSVAGARSTLLSLWKVDDDATAYFMERYYTLLKQGKGRMEALLAVQEEFRTKPLMPAWEDYRYWAAFQLVGETGPINGL